MSQTSLLARAVAHRQANNTEVDPRSIIPTSATRMWNRVRAHSGMFSLYLLETRLLPVPFPLPVLSPWQLESLTLHTSSSRKPCISCRFRSRASRAQNGARHCLFVRRCFVMGVGRMFVDILTSILACFNSVVDLERCASC